MPYDDAHHCGRCRVDPFPCRPTAASFGFLVLSIFFSRVHVGVVRGRQPGPRAVGRAVLLRDFLHYMVGLSP